MCHFGHLICLSTYKLSYKAAKKKAAVDVLRSKITQFESKIHSVQMQLKKEV